MTQEGQRIEFTGAGPYLLPVLTDEPEGALLEEQGVVVLQYGDVYLPVSYAGCADLVEALQGLKDVASEPEPEGATSLEFTPGAVLELPLLTAAAGPARQTENIVTVDVSFGDAAAQLSMSIKTAAMTGTLLTQAPKP